MSNTQFAFLERSNVPDRAALQTSIDSLGFNLRLNPSLDLLTDSGFSPCTLNGISDVGFELLSMPTHAMLEGDDFFLSLAGERDFCVGMSWRGSMQDCAAVMIVSCALAKDYGAIISYEGEPPEPMEALLQGTQEVVRDATQGC